MAAPSVCRYTMHVPENLKGWHSSARFTDFFEKYVVQEVNIHNPHPTPLYGRLLKTSAGGVQMPKFLKASMLSMKQNLNFQESGERMGDLNQKNFHRKGKNKTSPSPHICLTTANV